MSLPDFFSLCSALIVLLLASMCGSALAQTVIQVPQQQPTITAAIALATSGNTTIEVDTGTYKENIDFQGKDIVIVAVGAATIDGQQLGTVVTFQGTEPKTTRLTGFTIKNGYALRGGGINGNGTLATITNNTIEDNIAYGTTPNGRGGGIYSCNGLIQGNTIRNNSATYFGGGLYGCNGLATNGFGILGNNITNNVATYSGGGLSNCSGTISGNQITYNSSSQFGAGVSLCSGPISGNTITDNACLYGSGGGLQECAGEIKKNKIQRNTAYYYGSGLYQCSGLVDSNTITNNSVGRYGAGLYQCGGTIQNNIISENQSNINGAGLYDCDGGVIRNNTIQNNIATTLGGGLCFCDSQIVNCIIWGNSAAEGPQIFNSSQPITCDIENWVEDINGNIAGDPLLQDEVHLRIDSPCIDAGSGILFFTTDIDGDTRPYVAVTWGERASGSHYDIGADEFIGTVPAPTPTPTPTPTNSPTPLPTPEMSPVAHFTFDTGAEGWQFSGTVPYFDTPATTDADGHLGLNPNGSTNSFAYWTSPEWSILDGKLYRVKWAVASSAMDANKTGQFRLRVNQLGSWAAWDTTINSDLGQAPAAGDPRDYDVFVNPSVTDTSDSMAILSFDSLSFDPSDDTEAWIYLEEVLIEEVSYTVGGNYRSYDFTQSSHGWGFAGSIPPYDVPVPYSFPDQNFLGLNPQNSSWCFSYWFSPDIPIASDTLYRIQWQVGSDAEKANDVPGFRLRHNQKGNWRGWDRAVFSNLGAAPGSGETKTYDVIVEPQVTGTDDNVLVLSFDILSFDGTDDCNVTLMLLNVEVDEIFLNPF